MLQIKEIFKSDLDPNSPNWWAKDKVDKLNFNFNQLEDGGIPGPQGTQGSDGFTGEQGTQGVQGYLGPQGHLGYEGLSGKSTWRQHIDPNNFNKTIQPNFQGGAEYASIPFVVGADLADVGPQGSALYADALDWQNTSSIFYSNYGRNNFSIAYKGTKSNFKLHNGGGSNQVVNMDFGKLNTTAAGVHTINHNLENYDLNIKYLPTGNNLIDIDLNFFESINVINNFKGDVEIVEADDLHYDVNSLEGKVLVSEDSDGSVIWKNKFEVFSALPVGSVISIRHSDFNNTLFHIDDPSTDEDPSGYLRIIYGRGREGTMYEGWYLANGQTWQDGVLSFELPNLNSFEFNLTTTPNYEGAEQPISQSNPSPIIIAGGSMDLSADFVLTDPNDPSSTAGLYQVTHEYDSDDINIQLAAPSGTSDLAIKRNINIINLGETALYWQTTDTGGTSTDPITLSIGKGTQAEACDAGTQTYHWTAGNTSTRFTDLLDDLSGVSLYTDVSGSPGPSPVANWYSLSGIVRYWNGNAFTAVQECPVFYNVLLKNANSLLDLNGVYPLGNSTIFTIDQPLFKDATDLQISGINPSAGWYRENDSTNSYRRYWDGNQFLGTSISKNYVYAFDASRTSLSEYSNDTACTALNILRQIYFGRDTDYTQQTFPSTNFLVEAYNGGVSGGDTGVIYAELGWNPTAGSVYTVPLIEVYDQNKPNAQTPYASVVETNLLGNKTNRGLIKADSTILSIELCGDPNYITGTTSGNTSTTYTGTITVGDPQISVDLVATGSSVDSMCLTSGELQITGVGTLQVFTSGVNSGQPNTDTDSLSIQTAGTYNYSLSILNGSACSDALVEFTIS